MIIPEFIGGTAFLIAILGLLVLSFTVQFSITRFRLRHATLREPRDERYQTIRGEPVQVREDERLLVDRVGFLRQQWFISSGAIGELSEEEIDILAERQMLQTTISQQIIRNLKIDLPGVVMVSSVFVVLWELQPDGSDIPLVASIVAAFTIILVCYAFVFFPLLERRRIHRIDDAVAEKHGYEELANLLERITETNGEYPRTYTLLFSSRRQRIGRLREATK